MTTAVGFASLKLSGLPILDQFGTACTLGILSTLFWSFYIYSFSKNFAFSQKKHSQKVQKVLSNEKYPLLLLQNINKVKWLLPISMVLLTAAVFLGLPKLKVDTNLLDYLPQDSKVIADNKWFSESGMGVNRIELNLNASSLNKTEIEKGLTENQYLDYFWIDKPNQKVLSLASPHNASSNELSEWQAKVAELEFGGTNPEIGGFASLFALIFDELLDTQIKSGLTSFALILLMLALILRKIKWIIVGVLANSLPLLAILALLIYSGIGIDITTVCVTILTLGIVVDDTIHLLWNMNKCENEKNAESMKSVVGAISSTSIILGIGFAFLAFSSILSLHLFGLILALGIFVAWIFDLLLIPWCYPNLERDLK
jgi:predicted RND superfamily exporter protein